MNSYITRILSLLSILVFSLLMAFSSTATMSVEKHGSALFGGFRHLIFISVGLLFFVAINRFFTWNSLVALSPYVYIISLALLAAVLIPGIGAEINGARSWILLGGVAIQPAEVAKVGAALSTVGFIKKWGEKKSPYLIIVATWTPIIVLTMLEKDLGMSMMLAAVMVLFLIFEGISPLLVAASVGVVGVASALIIAFANFRSQRLIVFLQQFMGHDYDQTGAGYQYHQGLLALVRGGFFGVGIGHGEASTLYLPEGSNDFILAIIGEETGFIGISVLLILYFLLLRSFWVRARDVPSEQASFVKVGTTAIGIQAVVNIAYVTGLLPVTGLQLPLMSAGGTSMITTLILLGMMSVACGDCDKISLWKLLTQHSPRTTRLRRVPVAVNTGRRSSSPGSLVSSSPLLSSARGLSRSSTPTPSPKGRKSTSSQRLLPPLTAVKGGLGSTATRHATAAKEKRAPMRQSHRETARNLSSRNNTWLAS